MTLAEKARLMQHLDKVVASIEHDSVMGFACVLLHQDGSAMDISIMPGAKEIDKLIQMLDRMLFCLKLSCYTTPPGVDKQ
jgi:hypothetical protein